MYPLLTLITGAQQKSSHNLRLICGDVLLLCRDSDGTDKGLEGGMMRLNPRRIQTAMSLYTNDSSAIVIMTDREVNTITGLKEGKESGVEEMSFILALSYFSIC